MAPVISTSLALIPSLTACNYYLLTFVALIAVWLLIPSYGLHSPFPLPSDSRTYIIQYTICFSNPREALESPLLCYLRHLQFSLAEKLFYTHNFRQAGLAVFLDTTSQAGKISQQGKRRLLLNLMIWVKHPNIHKLSSDLYIHPAAPKPTWVCIHTHLIDWLIDCLIHLIFFFKELTSTSK